MPTIVERLYTPEDLPALRQLWAQAFEPEAVNRRETSFRWVTECNPACPDGAPRHLMMDGDTVVGSLGSMPVHFRVFGHPIEMHFSHDLLVDPTYRGFGLGKKLVQSVARASPSLAGGLWMTGPCYALHRKVGWLSVRPFPGHYFVLDAGAVLKRRLSSRIAGLLGPFAHAYLRLFRRSPGRGSLPAYEVNRFDGRVDELFERCAGAFGIIAERTHQYLNWKYVESPHVVYRRFMIGDQGSPDGYVVTRRQERGDGHTNGLIVDLLADASKPQAFDSAIAIAVDALRTDGAEIVYVLSTHVPFRQRLEALGFREVSRLQTFVVTGQEHLLSNCNVQDPSTWYLTYGDSDGDMWAMADSPRI